VEKHDLSLLSIFPVQIMKSFGEWLTVPLMNRILLGNLPLDLIRRSRIPDLSAANGQFMLFRAEVYRKYRFHEKVKEERVEDIRIIRQMKQEGLKVMTLLSNGQIACRMYRGFRDSIPGFSKNIHAFFGRNWPVLILYLVLTIAGFPAVYLSFDWIALVVYAAAQLFVIAGVSWLSRQSSPVNILLFPLQSLTLAGITAIAVYRQLTGRFYWKGRRIS
jgi:chlorobactene glucosyltransferase